MLYLFHGSDVEKTRATAFEWVAKARAKEPQLVYVRLAREELTSAALEDATLAGGLFVQRMLVLLDDPFPAVRKAADVADAEGEEPAEQGSVVEEYLDRLAASDNAILLLAPKLVAPKVKKILPKVKVEYKFDRPAQAGKPARGFNAGLVDALGARSREKLWLEVNRALRAGDAPEMLHGLLHWKARDLVMKGGRAWKPHEARALSLNLLSVLQESRRGGLELGLALERWALLG